MATDVDLLRHPIDVVAWARRVAIPERGIDMIRQIFSSQPDRRTRAGHTNMPVRFQSRKMGCTIQTEARTSELPAVIVEYEHNADVLAFLDQPHPRIRFCYLRDGRKVTFDSTEDFFVIRRQNAGWESWKTEEDLMTKATRDPARFVRTPDGWRCPPGEQFAAQFGLTYRLRTPAELNDNLVRNTDFLADYMTGKHEVAESVREAILEIARRRPGITVRDLIEAGLSPDRTYEHE
jgi:putative transposase